MLLYRAQSMPSGRRLTAPQSNDPATRVAGRWFTDDIEAAYRHLSGLTGPSHIVCVEIADAVAETFRVSNSPVTQCGLDPVSHSASPESDFVIPRFFALQAEQVEAVSEEGSAEIVNVEFAAGVRRAA